MRLSNVTIWTSDPAALRNWYSKYLNFSVDHESERFVLLTDDHGGSIAFHAGEPLATPERIQLHIEVDDVDAEYARLTSEGIQFEGAPSDRPWGVRSAATRDPAGHSVELTGPVASRPTEGQ